ncbi:hypothetical protein BX286_0430 [Streptomyces sp. 3211.6]|uniref:hypothetical protein n=1 Tax=Streptomyces TaxID=1883 RepID=UPI0009A50B05|nr:MULTISPECIES: hypothetical protein [Streptomyces]RKT02522.1 hypothetical protein BX286_0430 [Streptomyces sp. 3211.6]RPF43846.1 hypothetical protein EDD96_0359 [Streptomyces sp. Ag109_G2-6]
MKDPFACEEPALLARTGTADRAAARRAVASRATDSEDLRTLLDILGLRPADDPPAEHDRWRAPPSRP